jgi:AcrR family transcriptional regulator
MVIKTLEDSTRGKIEHTALRMFALSGDDNFSVRKLCNAADISASSLYHFYGDKDGLLKQVFDKTNTELGLLRDSLSHEPSVYDMLRQRIVFQFDHMEEIVFVLKYYLYYRDEFRSQSGGILPKKAYLHMQEVVQRGVDENIFPIVQREVEQHARVATHAVNGFLLELYPKPISAKEKKRTVDEIQLFLWKSLVSEGGGKR